MAVILQHHDVSTSFQCWECATVSNWLNGRRVQNRKNARTAEILQDSMHSRFTNFFKTWKTTRAFELNHTDSMWQYSAMCLKVVTNIFSIFHVETILSPWPSTKMDAQQSVGTIAKPKACCMEEGKFLIQRWREIVPKNITK